MARARRGGSTTLEEATPNDGKPEETTEEQARASAPPAVPASRELPALPTVKTTAAGVLEEKTVLLYGDAGIGKSTLASEWCGGNMFFFDCAGELSDLEVFRAPVADWDSFRLWAASYAEEMSKPSPQFGGAVIDTADIWAMHCAQKNRAKLGVAHESDAEWGKGWSLVKEDLLLRLSRLAALPGGLVLVSHAKEVEIKKRRQETYTRIVPTLTGGVREVVVNTADLVLFVDWAGETDDRVIYTKPSRDYEAKERGKVVRLPAEIPWPAGESGWEILKAAWYGG